MAVRPKLTMQDTTDHILACNVGDSETGLPWDFPGSLVVKIPCFKGRGVCSTPGWGTKIPRAMWCSQKMFKELRRAVGNKETSQGPVIARTHGRKCCGGPGQKERRGQ